MEIDPNFNELKCVLKCLHFWYSKGFCLIKNQQCMGKGNLKKWKGLYVMCLLNGLTYVIL